MDSQKRLLLALVLSFASGTLQYRHQEIGEAGASWDHPEYQPHVTLSWDAPEVDVDTLAAYSGPLVFGPEIFEPVNEDWRAGLTGDAAANPLDDEDADEIDAVSYDELEALFGAEMLASAGIRRPTQDTASWVSCSTSRTSRTLFSRLPPYSSVRLLRRRDRKSPTSALPEWQ